MYDVIVIGGGPGGYFAAIRAKQLGAKVVIIERDKIGGVCLNSGCIPTKTLLQSAEKFEEAKGLADFGILTEAVGFDYGKVFERKEQVMAQLRGGMGQVVKSQGVEYIEGQASILAPGKVQVMQGDNILLLETRNIIIATGAKPLELKMTGMDLPGVMNSDELLDFQHVPKSMLIIGAGAVGVEFASIFNSFGCTVTLVEMFPAILPNIDGDIVKRMTLIFKKQGIKIITNAKVKNIIKENNLLLVAADTNKGETQIEVETVLVAVGRKPVVEELGLEKAGVIFSARGISVNDAMQTNIAGVYAIGDVTGEYMWAHAASAEGLVAAENAMGKQATMDYTAMPGCVFTTPEIATVGLTEEEAQQRNLNIKLSRGNFMSNGKAAAMGHGEGFVKVIAEADTNKVIGMHIMGAHASDLIMEGGITVKLGLTSESLAQVIHPHPTLCETVHEAFHGIAGKNINQIKMKQRQ